MTNRPLGRAKGPGEKMHTFLFVSPDADKALKTGEFIVYHAEVDGQMQPILARITERRPLRLYPDGFSTDPQIDPNTVAAMVGYTGRTRELFEITGEVIGYYDENLRDFINPRVPPGVGTPIYLAENDYLSRVLSRVQPGRVGAGTPAGGREGSAAGPGKGEGSEEEVKWGDEASGAEEASGTTKPTPRRETASAGAGSTVPAEGSLNPPEEGFSWPQVRTYVTGTISLLNKSADAVSRGQVIGLGTTLAAIFVVMSLLFISPRIGILAMIPNVVPVFLLFGLMGFTGISLNFSTSLIASIAVGIGVDDTIHYIARFNQEVQNLHDQNEAMVRTLRSLGKPMIYTSVALMFGFGIFMLSDFVPIRQFGFLTAFTLLAAMVSNLIILPSLLVSVRIVTLWDLMDLAIGDNPAHYIKIFHGLSNHQAKIAVLMGYLKEYQDGEYILRDGEMGSEMFVILKGLVDIVKGEGPDEILLATTQPGDAFGEMALLRHTSRTASARARGEVKLFVIDEQTFFRLQKRYPRIASNILYQIAQTLTDREYQRMRDLARRVSELYYKQREEMGFPWLQDKQAAVENLAKAVDGTALEAPQTFLLEIGTEELPAADLRSALEQLQESVQALLDDTRLEHGAVRILGTPRRLVAVIEELAARQEDRTVVVKGPPANRAFDAQGKPTPAGEGFARSRGLTIDQLEVREIDGGQYAAAVLHEPGPPAMEGRCALYSGYQSSRNVLPFASNTTAL
jgi:CRP-like cAMP-binding protein